MLFRSFARNQRDTGEILREAQRRRAANARARPGYDSYGLNHGTLLVSIARSAVWTVARSPAYAQTSNSARERANYPFEYFARSIARAP